MADYETIQRRRNIVVGLFVLLALVAFAWLIYKFGELPTLYSQLTGFQINAQFASAPGIQEGTPVRLGGYQIGKVIDIVPPRVREDRKTGLKYLQTTAVLSIDQQYKNIPSNANIKLMRRGLGSSYIEIKIDPTKPTTPRDPNRPETAFLQPGMTLQGSVGTVSEFFPEESQQQLNKLITNLNDLIVNANNVIGDIENQNNIHTTLANLSAATARATETLEEIRRFSKAGRESIENADDRLARVSDMLVSSGEQLGLAVRELHNTLNKLNSGQGTAGKFLTDARLYENLLESTEELKKALQEFKQVMEKTNARGGVKVSIF